MWWLGAKYVSLEKTHSWFCGWSHENYIFCICYISIEEGEGWSYARDEIHKLRTICDGHFMLLSPSTLRFELVFRLLSEFLKVISASASF